MTATRLVIRGVVQGVGFRQSTAAEAARLGVLGWVRNLPDGAVEAWLEGDDAAVAALVAWCRRGPRHAVVSDVALTVEALAGHTRFEVRR